MLQEAELQAFGKYPELAEELQHMIEPKDGILVAVEDGGQGGLRKAGLPPEFFAKFPRGNGDGFWWKLGV